MKNQNNNSRKKLTLEKLTITKLDTKAKSIYGGNIRAGEGSTILISNLLDNNDNDGSNTTINTSVAYYPEIHTLP